MKNINKNLILGLGITLAILAILGIGGILMPTKAHAMSSSVKWCNNCMILPEKNYSTPVYQPASPSSVNTVYQTQPVVYQNKQAPNANTNTTSVSAVDTKTSAKTITTNDYKSLTASSVFGGYSFMPSGLMQWILLAIFILVIVILVRKVTGVGEDYHNSPLKHA